MPARLRIGCLALLLAVMSPAARADVTLYIQDTTVAQGDKGTVNIYISSNDASNDTFSEYQLQIHIQAEPSTPSAHLLEFAANSGDLNPTPVSQDYSYLNSSDYIFPSMSFAGSNGVPGGIMDPSSSMNDTFLVSDFTSDLSTPFAPSSNTPTSGGPLTLLASLVLYDKSGVQGDKFLVSVTGYDPNNPVSYFDTFPLFGSAGSLNFAQDTSVTGYGGIVTIGPAGPVNVVPEPVSTITSLTGAFFFTAYGWLRLRRSRVRTADLPPG